MAERSIAPDCKSGALRATEVQILLLGIDNYIKVRYYLFAMARKCEITGRKTVTGHTRKHQRGSSGGVSGTWSRKAPATKRTWRPNLTKVRVEVAGVPKRLKISMKAYKQLKADGRIGDVVLANTK